MEKKKLKDVRTGKTNFKFWKYILSLKRRVVRKHANRDSVKEEYVGVKEHMYTY